MPINVSGIRGILEPGAPHAAVELIRRSLGWGDQLSVFSHACVTSHLGLAHAARMLHAGLADRVLVLSFDFLSPFRHRRFP
jgi:3-oxoacyl-[acyl-carrier-protein] synthase III